MRQISMDMGTGPLPAGWKWVKLGDVIRQISNGTSATQNKEGKGYRITRIESISQGVINHERVGSVELEKNQVTKYRLNPGDILFSHINSLERLGNCAIYDSSNSDLIHGMNLLRVQVETEQIFPKFLLMYFRTSTAQRYHLDNAKRAIGQASLNIQDLRGLPVQLPPLEEQKRIAAILDEQMAAVEKAKKAAEERLEAAKVLPTAYLREVFEGKESKSWSEFRFGDIVTNHDGKRIPVKLSDRRQMSGEFPYYGASGIIDYVDDYLFEGQHLLIGEDGANLLLRSSLIAFLADGKFWVNNHAHVLAAKSPFNNRLLAYAIESMDLSPYVAGSAQPKLTQGNLNNILLRLPQNSDQIEQLTSTIESHITGASLVSDSIQQELETIEAMPAALLRKAFSGQL